MGAIDCIVNSKLADKVKLAELEAKVKSLVDNGKHPLEAERIVKNEFIAEQHEALNTELNDLKKSLGLPQSKLPQQEKADTKQIEEEYDAKIGGIDAPPPVTEPTTGGVYSERPGTELSFRGLQNVANEFGLEDVEGRERKSDIKLYSDARAKMDSWVEKGTYSKNIEKLLSGVENRELNLTDEQRVILQQHLANEVGKLREIKDNKSPEWQKQFEVVKRIKEIGNIARSESGAALRIPIGMTSHPVSDYGDAMVAMSEASSTDVLTDAQKAEVEKYVAEYEEKLKVSEQKVNDIQAKYAELQAKKAVSETAAKVKKTNKDYSAERKQIVSDIREKLKKSRGELSSAPIPYAKELFEIAPDVAKLVKSLVEQGVSKLEDVVKEVYGIISPEIPDIKESDVVDLVAGLYDKKKETKVDLQTKLKGIANKKSSEALKIQARIKAGDFDTPAKATSWVSDAELKSKYPQLYNEALDALYAKEQAKLDFDIALYKAQLAKRNKVQKGIDISRALIATTKAIKSGIDDSAIMMQNIVAMIAHPRSAIKALREHALDALSEKRFRRYLTELHQSPIWNLMEQSGLDITNPQSLKEQNKEEIFDNNLLNKDIVIKGKKYNIGKYATRPFERAFTSLGNAMRVNMFTKIAERWVGEGKSFETHPEEFKSLAKMLNTQTGRGKLHTQVERASQLITAGIWSPRLMASRLNMLGLGDVGNTLWGGKGYYKNLTPEVRKMALLDLAKFIGAGVALMGLAGAGGAGTDDDPYSPTFGTIQIGNRRYNAWGGFTPYVKTIFQAITGKRHIRGEEQDVSRAKVIGSFFRSRLTPAAGVATNIAVGKDFSGKEITAQGELANLVMPLSVNSVANAVQKDGITGLFLEGLPSFIGVGVSDERDFENTIKKVPKIYFKGVYVELPDNLKNSYQELIKKKISDYKEQAKKDPKYESLSAEQKKELDDIAKNVGTNEAEKEMIRNNKDFFISSSKELKKQKKQKDFESKELKKMLN